MAQYQLLWLLLDSLQLLLQFLTVLQTEAHQIVQLQQSLCKNKKMNE